MVVYRELETDRRFGVEYEVAATLTKLQIQRTLEDFESQQVKPREVKSTSGAKGWSETRRNNYWHVKYDSTCGFGGKGVDHGWEVASYIGRGYQDVQHIAEIATVLHDAGLQVNDNCGLHVHVEAADIEPLQMSHLLAWWLKTEDIIYALCDPYRRFNCYCRSLRSEMAARNVIYDPLKIEHLWRFMQPYDLCIHENYDKKVSLNTVGYAKGLLYPKHDRRTIEIRVPECQLNRTHAENWIRFSIHLVEQFYQANTLPSDLESTTSVTDFLTYLGLHGEGDSFVLLDERLLGCKCWILKRLKGVHRYRQEAEKLLALFR